MGPAADRRRPDRAADRRAAWIGLDAPERHDRRGGRALVLRRPGPAPPDRLRGGQLPLGALPLPGAARARRRRGGRRRRRGRGDRRPDAARAGDARALQDRRDPGRRGDRRARARAWSAGRPRRVPVGRDRAARRDGARRRFRRRRLGQVALRRPGSGVALRAARPRADPRACAHRLAGAQAALRLRARAGLRGRARRASSPARRTCPRSMPRPRATT